MARRGATALYDSLRVLWAMLRQWVADLSNYVPLDRPAIGMQDLADLLRVNAFAPYLPCCCYARSQRPLRFRIFLLRLSISAKKVFQHGPTISKLALRRSSMFKILKRT